MTCERRLRDDVNSPIPSQSKNRGGDYCSAKAAKEDTYGARNGFCNTKCWRRCRDEVKGRDADVREALESEKLACLSDCGR